MRRYDMRRRLHRRVDARKLRGSMDMASVAVDGAMVVHVTVVVVVRSRVWKREIWVVMMMNDVRVVRWVVRVRVVWMKRP